MFRTISGPLSAWESQLPAELLRLPEELARVDALLDDPAFFAPFAPYFHPVLGRARRPPAVCAAHYRPGRISGVAVPAAAGSISGLALPWSAGPISGTAAPHLSDRSRTNLGREISGASTSGYGLRVLITVPFR